MSRRDPRAIAGLCLLLTGCGGPSATSILRSALVAAPLVHVTLLLFLVILENVRRRPDLAEGSVFRPALARSGGLAALSLVLLLLSGQKPDMGLVFIAWLVLGSAGLLVATIAWRARQGVPYPRRVLAAALAGMIPSLPVLVLWPASLSGLAEKYVDGMTLAGFLTLFAGPVVYLGILVESAVRRRKEPLG